MNVITKAFTLTTATTVSAASAAECDPATLPPFLVGKVATAVDLTKLYFGKDCSDLVQGIPVVKFTCDQGRTHEDPNSGSVYNQPDQIEKISPYSATAEGGQLNFAATGGLELAERTKTTFSAEECGIFSCSTQSASYGQAFDAVTAESQVVGISFEMVNGNQVTYYPPKDWQEKFTATEQLLEIKGKYVPNGTQFTALTRPVFDKFTFNVGGTHFPVDGKFCVAALYYYTADTAKLSGFTSKEVEEQGGYELGNIIAARGGGSGFSNVSESFESSLVTHGNVWYGGDPASWPKFVESAQTNPDFCTGKMQSIAILFPVDEQAELQKYIQERIDRSALKFLSVRLAAAIENDFGIKSTQVSSALKKCPGGLTGNNCISANCPSNCPSRPCGATPCFNGSPLSLPIVAEVTKALATHNTTATVLKSKIDSILSPVPGLPDNLQPVLDPVKVFTLETEAAAILMPTIGGYTIAPSMVVDKAVNAGGCIPNGCICGDCTYHNLVHTNETVTKISYPKAWGLGDYSGSM